MCLTHFGFIKNKIKNNFYYLLKNKYNKIHMDDPDITKQNFSLFVCLHFRGGWTRLGRAPSEDQYLLSNNIYYSYTYV
jgi:hypothetical protein